MPHNCVKLIAFALLIGFQSSYANKINPSTPSDDRKYLRAIYLVSKDKEPRAEYLGGIRRALQEVQQWYKSQLDGFTFLMDPNDVEIVRADVDSKYFASNPNGADPARWGVLNCEQVARRIKGARFLDPSTIWVVYSDSPGWGGQGGSGFTCMPEEDLHGLLGESKEARNTDRWIGGLAHEIGHALGLPHPPDMVQSNKALMAFGWYADWPDRTYLTENDKKKLQESPFLFKDNQPILGPITDIFFVNDGWFEKRANGFWYEYKHDKDWMVKFLEIDLNNSYRTLYDDGRKLYLRIPTRGGKGFLSSDDQKTWNYVFDVRSAKLK